MIQRVGFLVDSFHKSSEGPFQTDFPHLASQVHKYSPCAVSEHWREQQWTIQFPLGPLDLGIHQEKKQQNKALEVNCNYPQKHRYIYINWG